MAKIRFCLLVFCHLGCLRGYAAPDTMSVFFPFNISLLSEHTHLQIDSLIYSRSLSDARPLQIIGYADQVGGDSYNLRLSKQRAENVKSYLIQSGFRDERITLLTGRGEQGAAVAQGREGNVADRRVDIVQGRASVNKRQPDVQTFTTVPVQRKASTTDWKTVKPGETILIDNIYFYAGRHYVRKESDEALIALYEALELNPGLRISIEGHVCCISGRAPDALDDDTRKMELSLNRARAIREYLINQGIDPSRIEYAGFGRRRPIVAVERNEEDADRNRRVEIRVIQ